MQRFKSPGSAQRFLNLHSAAYNTLAFQRHLLDRSTFNQYRDQVFANWKSAASAA